MRYKLIYAIIGSIILPIIIVVNFKSTGADPCLANIVSSIGIGVVGGFLVGLIKDRQDNLRNRLLHVVDDRTKQLARKAGELETSKKHTAVLRNLLPLCPACRNIKSSNGDWQHIETYLQHYSTDGYGDHLCPDCSYDHSAAGPQLDQQPAAG